MFLMRWAVLSTAPLLYLLIVAGLAACLGFAVSRLSLIAIDFHLSVTRGAQFILLLSLFPLARSLRIGVAELGIPASMATSGRQLVIGFLVGLLILTTHVALLLTSGAIKPNPDVVFDAAEVWSAFRRAVGVGFLVATVEELIFRGMLLSGLRRFGSPWSAAVITAFYYALLHFVKSDLRPGPGEVDWTSGFRIFAEGIHYLLYETPVDSLLALFCAGLFLAVIRLLIPKSLPLCIGIHAGWVVVIKVARRLTDPDPQAALVHLVGPYDQIIGYGAAAWIMMLLIGFVAYTHGTRSPRPR